MSRSSAIHVRNLREGEESTFPPALRDTGMIYLDCPWIWVVESLAPPSPLGPFAPAFPPPAPFALVVTSFAHGWLVLWRVLAISPLPSQAPLNWFLEALPQVFAAARARGCVGFVTLLADDRPEEVKIARIILRLTKGGIVPFHGSIGAGVLYETEKEGAQ